MADRLQLMFDQHSELQQRYIGQHPSTLTGDELVQYIKDMYIATIKELGEMLDEVNWKPWTSGNEVNFHRAKQEIIDEWHFLMNRWLALGGTAQEFYTMYIVKNAVNHQRVTDGYDGRSTKCAECHTDLDELDNIDKVYIIAHRDDSSNVVLRFCNMKHHDEYFKRRRQAALDALEGAGSRGEENGALG